MQGIAKTVEMMIEAAVIHPDESDEYGTEERCYILEMSNSTRDEALSVARGVTTAWHYVEGTAERYVILSGEGRVEVEGLTPDSVASGDVVIIPPDVRQRITNVGSDDLVFLALCTPRFRPERYIHDE